MIEFITNPDLIPILFIVGVSLMVGVMLWFDYRDFQLTAKAHIERDVMIAYCENPKLSNREALDLLYAIKKVALHQHARAICQKKNPYDLYSTKWVEIAKNQGWYDKYAK